MNDTLFGDKPTFKDIELLEKLEKAIEGFNKAANIIARKWGKNLVKNSGDCPEMNDIIDKFSKNNPPLEEIIHVYS